MLYVRDLTTIASKAIKINDFVYYAQMINETCPIDWGSSSLFYTILLQLNELSKSEIDCARQVVNARDKIVHD